eukprot:3151842-Lingulodinium_polyedra.AAC.1
MAAHSFVQSGRAVWTTFASTMAAHSFVRVWTRGVDDVGVDDASRHLRAHLELQFARRRLGRCW